MTSDHGFFTSLLKDISFRHPSEIFIFGTVEFWPMIPKMAHDTKSENFVPVYVKVNILPLDCFSPIISPNCPELLVTFSYVNVFYARFLYPTMVMMDRRSPRSVRKISNFDKFNICRIVRARHDR